MSHQEITFFEFKEDDMGMLMFGVRSVSSKDLETFYQFWSIYTQDLHMGDWLRDNLRYADKLLDGKIWIGHGIEESDVPRFKKDLQKFNIEIPKAKSIIDTKVLLSQDPELGRLAVRFGLGEEGPEKYDSNLQNIDAIKHCEAIVLSYEPNKFMKYEGGPYNPMISYLIDLQETANTNARFSELDINER